MKRFFNKRLLSGLALLPLIAGLVATGCEVEVGKDDSKIATWVGWPADGSREAYDSTTIRFTFTEPVESFLADDVTITEEGASGYAEKQPYAYTTPDLRAADGGKTWLLIGVSPRLEGLAKVTIENDKIEKTLHGVPIFKALPRKPYRVDAVSSVSGGPTDFIKITFTDENEPFAYSEYYGDDAIPTTADVSITGDAVITADMTRDNTDDRVFWLPIKATKFRNGSVKVFIERAGVDLTNNDNGMGVTFPSQSHMISSPNLIGVGAQFTGLTADGGDNTFSTSELTLTFNRDVDLSSLNANDYFSATTTTVTPNLNNEYKFIGTGDGKKWILPVKVTNNDSVTINFSPLADIFSGITSQTVSVYKAKATWGVEGQNSSNQNPQYYGNDTETNRTTAKLVFTFSDTPTVPLTIGSITLANVTGEATAGSLTGNTLTITTTKAGTITVRIAGNTSILDGTQTVQLYKYAPPPTPPPSQPPQTTPPASTPPAAQPPAAQPENKDPFKAGYPVQVNPAGRNLQVEVYKKGYSDSGANIDTNKYFPFGDNTREQVTGHNSWYEVQIAPATADLTDNSKWKKITSAPQVSASGVLGSYYCVYWPVTPSARNGMGKIVARIRARNSDNPSSQTNWGDWVTFTNGGKGW